MSRKVNREMILVRQNENCKIFEDENGGEFFLSQKGDYSTLLGKRFQIEGLYMIDNGLGVNVKILLAKNTELTVIGGEPWQ